MRLANPRHRAQRGYTLVSVLLIVMIIGVSAVGGMNTGMHSERLAGSAIQRDRAFQAADGGAAFAERKLQVMVGRRVFADETASEGIFSLDDPDNKWWRTATYSGEIHADTGTILGVVSPPRYIYEEIGSFVTDGGTGVSSVDIGSAVYGRTTRSGRDVVVYRIESHGLGSYSEVQSVVETVVAHSL